MLTTRSPALIACSCHASRYLGQDFSFPKPRTAIRFARQRRSTGCCSFTTITAGSATAEQQFSVYDHPELCDAAFNFRDFDREVDFLEQLHALHNGNQASSFLELGCGAANHAIRLAVKGHTVFALDIHKPQLDYAQEKAEKAGAVVRFLWEDMCTFELPDEATVDMALLLLGTMNHLQTHDQAQCCLDGAYVALKPGGLLLIELQHPHDLFDGSFIKGDFWEADLEADKQVILEYGTDDDWFDPVQQVLRKRVGLSVRQGNDVELIGESYVWQRVYTYQELELLAESIGFQVVAAYGDLDIEVDLDHKDAARLILCLRRPEVEDDELDAQDSDRELEFGSSNM